MRLSRVKPVVAAVGKGSAVDVDAPWLPCPKCRTPTRPNKICTVCGTRVKAADA
jgi:hypothetical protein